MLYYALPPPLCDLNIHCQHSLGTSQGTTRFLIKLTLYNTVVAFEMSLICENVCETTGSCLGIRLFLWNSSSAEAHIPYVGY